MKEFELIGLIARNLPANAATVVGAGDDCAVIDLGLPNRWLLFKTDAVVEGIHFNAATPAEKVGHKAIGRCLSDIAAMAGHPVCALVTLALPCSFEPRWVEAAYRGMGELARRYQVAIAGGETTANPERRLISVAMLGMVDKDKCLLRSGAKAGDAIFVTGELGGSLAGKHLDFEPRLKEARWLAGHYSVHAMIDLSDGLAGDLRHMLQASHVGAELLASAIPVSREARLPEHRSGAKSPLQAALTDGEDFELLFAVPSTEAAPLLNAWKQEFPNLRLTCIGKIMAAPGLKLRDQERTQEVTDHGYEHFA
jgi:thiamine-monophosphate kinase